MNNFLHINPGMKLSRKEINAIKEALIEIRTDFDWEQFRAERYKILNKISSLEKARAKWLKSLATYSKTLLHIIDRAEDDLILMANKDILIKIASSLIYLAVNKDVIPDTVPGRGYLDDAYAIEASLKLIKDFFPEIYENFSQAA